jgi:hypothetical protein
MHGTLEGRTDCYAIDPGVTISVWDQATNDMCSPGTSRSPFDWRLGRKGYDSRACKALMLNLPLVICGKKLPTVAHNPIGQRTSQRIRHGYKNRADNQCGAGEYFMQDQKLG